MKKLFGILILIAIVLAVVLPFTWKYFFGESDKAAVNRRLHEVARTVEKNGREGLLIEVEHAKDASKYFDEICDIRLPRFGKDARMTPDNIVQNTLMLRRYGTVIHLSIHDPQYEFPEDQPGTCLAQFTAMLVAETSGGDRFREAFELEATWTKKNGEWMISRLGFAKILEK